MISITGLRLSHGPHVVVDNLTFLARPGEVVVLLGESGVGKTSLLRSLYGDLRPEDGVIHVDGVSVFPPDRRKFPSLRRRMGLIFQDDKLLDDRTVFENIRFALAIQSIHTDEARRRAMEVLSDLGLSHARNKYPDQLSAGEAQRIGVARALASHPRIILADEPTGDLDLETSRVIFQWLRGHNRDNTVMIIATHDAALAREILPASRVLRMAHGSLDTVA